MSRIRKHYYSIVYQSFGVYGYRDLTKSSLDIKKSDATEIDHINILNGKYENAFLTKREAQKALKIIKDALWGRIK